MTNSSGGIPSPIWESKDFKKLLDFKEDEAESSFNSRWIKKIEFSDDQNRQKKTPKQRKKKEWVASQIEDKDESFSIDHSSIDWLVFGSDKELSFNRR